MFIKETESLSLSFRFKYTKKKKNQVSDANKIILNVVKNTG